MYQFDSPKDAKERLVGTQDPDFENSAIGYLKSEAESDSKVAGEAAFYLSEYFTPSNPNWTLWHKKAVKLNYPKALANELLNLTIGRRNHEGHSVFTPYYHNYAVDVRKRLRATGDDKWNQFWELEAAAYNSRFPYSLYYEDLSSGQQVLKEYLTALLAKERKNANAYLAEITRYSAPASQAGEEKVIEWEKQAANTEVSESERSKAIYELSRIYKDSNTTKWQHWHNKALESKHPIAIFNELTYIIFSRRNHINEDPTENLHRARELYQDFMDTNPDDDRIPLKYKEVFEFRKSQLNQNEFVQKFISSHYSNIEGQKILLKQFFDEALKSHDVETLNDYLSDIDTFKQEFSELDKQAYAQWKEIKSVKEHPLQAILQNPSQQDLEIFVIKNTLNKIFDEALKTRDVETLTNLLSKIYELKQKFNELDGDAYLEWKESKDVKEHPLQTILNNTNNQEKYLALLEIIELVNDESLNNLGVDYKKALLIWSRESAKKVPATVEKVRNLVKDFKFETMGQVDTTLQSIHKEVSHAFTTVKELKRGDKTLHTRYKTIQELSSIAVTKKIGKGITEKNREKIERDFDFRL